MAKTENLFESNLTKSNKAIKATRAKKIGTLAEMAQDDLVKGIQRTLIKLETKQEDLEDLSPDTTMSLNPIKGEFNAEKWVTEIQETALLIANTKLELQIAKATYDKYFKV